ncbi:hypothetical protein JG688_00007815 [Phytophthora aleatoria]|uniref:Uncharacterized protein n=1 Tax=Phytophthora aleatoria TaxID=2496075 RepID=A0A8J5IIY6_9STRA|nr:hypothetical protein JG688_00007815 [Phytophthora aleatoria]
MVLLGNYGISSPDSSPPSVLTNGIPRFRIDRAKQAAYSELLRRSKMSLPDLIRHVRGETRSDPRLNKALHIPDHLPSWKPYRYKDQWRNIVTHRVRPTWRNSFQEQKKPLRMTGRPYEL